MRAADRVLREGQTVKGTLLIRQALSDVFLSSGRRHPVRALVLTIPVAIAVVTLYPDLYWGRWIQRERRIPSSRSTSP